MPAPLAHLTPAQRLAREQHAWLAATGLPGIHNHWEGRLEFLRELAGHAPLRELVRQRAGGDTAAVADVVEFALREVHPERLRPLAQVPRNAVVDWQRLRAERPTYEALAARFIEFARRLALDGRLELVADITHDFKVLCGRHLLHPLKARHPRARCPYDFRPLRPLIQRHLAAGAPATPVPATP